jgi:AcrR family transcriptional regulator
MAGQRSRASTTKAVAEDRRPLRSSDRILAAAAALAKERGIHGATIAAVSQRSGLPASSIYWHFADKDALFAAVIRADFARWLTTVPQWSSSEGQSLREGLATILLPTVPSLRDVPDFLRIGMQVILDQRQEYAAAREAFLGVRGQVSAMITAWLDRALGPAVEPTDVEALTRLILNFTDGIVVGSQVFEKLDIPAYSDLFLDVFVEAAAHAAGTTVDAVSGA